MNVTFGAQYNLVANPAYRTRGAAVRLKPADVAQVVDRFLQLPEDVVVLSSNKQGLVQAQVRPDLIVELPKASPWRDEYAIILTGPELDEFRKNQLKIFPGTPFAQSYLNNLENNPQAIQVMPMGGA